MRNPFVTTMMRVMGLSLALALGLVGTAWPANLRYTFVDTGPQTVPDGGSGIDQAGDFLGTMLYPDGRTLATLWRAGVYLPVNLTPDPTAHSSYANGISSNGRCIVGGASTDRFEFNTPWMWTSKTGFAWLPPGHGDTWAFSVNNDCDAVGRGIYGPVDARDLVLWHNGVEVDITTLLDPQTAAQWHLLEGTLITNQGVIGGLAAPRHGNTWPWHGFLLIPQGHEHD